MPVFLEQLLHRLQEPGGQKAPCPPNIWDLLQLLIAASFCRGSDKEVAALLHLFPFLQTASHLAYRVFKVTLQGVKRLMPFFLYFYCFTLLGARHWRLDHSVMMAYRVGIRKSLCMSSERCRLRKDTRRPNVYTSGRPLTQRQPIINKRTTLNPKQQQTLGRWENLIFRVTTLLDSNVHFA